MTSPVRIAFTIWVYLMIWAGLCLGVAMHTHDVIGICLATAPLLALLYLAIYTWKMRGEG